MKNFRLAIFYLMMFLIGFNIGISALDAGPIMGFKIGYNLNYGGELNANNTLLKYDHSDSLSIQLTTGIRIEGLRIIGVYENTLRQVALDSYNPIQDEFTVKITYSFLDFEIGFEHMCNHTVKTQVDERTTYSNLSRRIIYLSYCKEF